MAYVHTSITGNTSFGGYLSVDGEKAFAIRDDMTYEISEGKHSFQIFSKSNAERNYGKFQLGASALKSSHSLLDDVIDVGAINSLGDSWTFDAILEDADCIAICVTSRGQSLVGTPMYEIQELSEEAAASLNQQFEEMRNTPRRSKKQIGWGIGLVLAFTFGTYNMLTSGEAYELPSLLFFIGMIGLGVVLFLLGMRKKVRR